MKPELAAITRKLHETADYATRPAFKDELRKHPLAQFRNAQLRAHVADTLIANMKRDGMTDEQILQLAGDICPCASCRKEREERP